MRSLWLIAALCSCVVTRHAHAQPAAPPPPDCPPGAHCEQIDVPPPEGHGEPIPIPDFCPPSPTCEGALPHVEPPESDTVEWPLERRPLELEATSSMYDDTDFDDDIPYSAGDPIPPGFEVETKTHSGLLGAGTLVFGVSYLPWAIIGLFSLESNARIAYTAVPLIGPPALAIDYELNTDLTVLLVANAGVQFVGITLMALSPLFGDMVLVPDGSAARSGPRVGLR